MRHARLRAILRVGVLETGWLEVLGCASGVVRPALLVHLPHVPLLSVLTEESLCHLPHLPVSLPPPSPPAGSLVKALEEAGIGRPSTYAPTLNVLQQRGYVRKEARALHAEPLGRILTAFLQAYFPQVGGGWAEWLAGELARGLGCWQEPALAQAEHGVPLLRLLASSGSLCSCTRYAFAHPPCSLQYVDYGFTSGLEEQLDVVSGGRVCVWVGGWVGRLLVGGCML